MLFRGRQAASSVWRRFRADVDDFTFARVDGVYEAHVAANAERVVELMVALAAHLPPAVDVALEDVRSGRAWRGVDVALPDVREALARLKVPLSAYGGVELAVYTSDDQLTVTPDLELFVFARTDRWLYILQGKGLVEAESLPADTWQLQPESLGAAPELAQALGAVVERLGLTSA